MQVPNLVLLLVTLIKSVTSQCVVGLLHDDTDNTKHLTFLTETKRHGLENIIEPIAVDHPYDTLKTTCSLLEQGVIALFGPTTTHNFQVVESVCNSKDIPHLETRWNDNLHKSLSTVNLYPSAEKLAEAVADIVKSMEWDTFTVFYEDDDSLSRISGILKVRWEYAISIKQLDDGKTGNYRPVLKEARRAGHKYFVIDCHTDNLSNVLKQAQQVGLMTRENAYLIANLDLQTIDLEPYKYSNTNITGIRMIDPDAEAALALAASINDKRREMERYESNEYTLSNEIRLETALLADAIHLFYLALSEMPEYGRCAAVALCDNDIASLHGSSIINFLTTNTFDGITGNIKLDSKGYRQEFELDIVELNETGLSKIGSWNTSEGITILGDNDDDDLQNKSFIVITALTEPYGMLKQSAKKLEGNDRYEGFAIDIIHELSLVEKFNYTFVIREDNANGVKLNEHEWSGMIGDLLKKKADLAITDLTITSDRKEAVDFTTPFMNLGISILYQKPKKAPPNFFSFAAPFAVEVWVWICGAYFISSISLFIMGRLCPSEWNNPYPCVENPEYLINQFSLRNSLWFMTGSVLQQGSEIAPIAYATRMTAGAWWFFTLIMVSTYTANLAAFLTTENVDQAFNNVHDLLEKAPRLGISYGAKANGATLAFFKESTSYEFKEIYKNIREEDLVAENKKGVDRAESENYAFFMESVSIEYETERHCNLTQVGGMLDEKGYGIAMRKNSSYRHKLSTAVLKLQENGKIDELKRKWWEERKGGGQCKNPPADDAPPLTLKHVGGVFWVTIAGTLIALLLVVLEMVLHILKESLRQKKSFWIELKEEMKFYLKFRGLVKPVRRNNESRSKSPIGSQRSIQLEKNADEMGEEVEVIPENAPYGFLPDITNSTTTNL